LEVEQWLVSTERECVVDSRRRGDIAAAVVAVVAVVVVV
jgi:hypothetical protein